MIRPSLIALACALGLPAAAQDVVVRTGEHGPFTRVVLGFDDAPSFALERSDGGLRLRTGEERARFDLSDAWRRIDRRRISAIAPGPDGALDLDLACDCVARAFVQPPGLLVLDVAARASDLPEPPITGAVTATLPAPELAPELGPEPAPRAPLPAAELPVVLPELLSPLMASGLPLLSPAGAPSVTGSAPAPAQVAEEPAAAPEPRSMPEPEPEPAPEPDLDLAAFGGNLQAQLARGVDRGLLEPAAELPEAADGPRPVGRQLRVVTAADRDAISPAADGPAGISKDACPSRAVSALLPGAAPEDGAGAPGAIEAIVGARRALYGEFDRLDAGAARGLVRALLAAGLGAELRDVLPLAVEAGALSRADRADLDAVGALMDGPAPAEAAERWDGCDGAAALWSVLAMEGRPLPRALDRSGVVGAVSVLPEALRVHLAPRLAGAFLADGDTATARLVRNAATRAGGAPDRAMRLLELRLEVVERGPDPSTAARLARLASDTDDVAAQAALLLFQTAGGAAPDASLLDAELLVTERRGTEEGERLRAALASAYMGARRWDDALALARAAPPSDRATAALWEAVARGLADDASDAAFLRLTFAEGSVLAAAPISPEAAAAIALRREGLGFGPDRRPPSAPEVGADAAPSPAAPADPSPAPLEAAPEVALVEDGPAGPGSGASLAAPGGPIALGLDRLEDSRRRRAALAARLAEIAAESEPIDASAEPSTLR